MKTPGPREELTQTVVSLSMPESNGGFAVVGYVCDAIGRKVKAFRGQTNAEAQAALRLVNFDIMPPGWFIIVRKAPRP